MPYRVTWKGVDIWCETEDELDRLLEKLCLSPASAPVLTPVPVGTEDDAVSLLKFLRALMRFPKGVASSRFAAVLGFPSARRISGRWMLWSKVLAECGEDLNKAVLFYRSGGERALIPGPRLEKAIQALEDAENSHE